MASSKGSARGRARRSSESPRAYPFTAVVGQDEMRLALLLNVVEPSIGGVLITGHRGTGKSTAVRALAELLPPLTRSARCHFNCDPDQTDELCDSCRDALASVGKLKRERVAVPVVDLPLNATEDRVCGSINLERALREGVRAFEPGLLARAHRGFLYIDEVNLLEDHLVDLLLDVSATGRNRVEREGVSAEHSSRFVLIGSSNPEEGELRPQLLDRFGLCAEVRTPADAETRAEVVARREAFDRDPAAFREAAEAEQSKLRRRLVRARRNAARVGVPRELLRAIAELCARLGVDGHRGELTIARASRALAAFEGRAVATAEDARRVAPLALRHRLRRDPFEPAGGGEIEKTAEELFGGESEPRERNGEGHRSDKRHRSDERRHDDERREGGAHEASSGDETREAARVSSPDGEGDGSCTTRPAPALDAQVRLDERGRANAERARKAAGAESRGRARSVVAGGARGRFFGASSATPVSHALAFDATLRAAAERLARRGDGADRHVADRHVVDRHLADRHVVNRRLADRQVTDRHVVDLRGTLVAAEDLRFKLFSRREGTLYIFAVDASGSMAVNRIGQAKGALARLLRRSYVRRDRVALVTFRGARGEVLLQPARSPALAHRLLDALPVGGATPLASGLQRAHEIAARARREGAGRVALLVFTDGRANVAAASTKYDAASDGNAASEGDVDRAGARLRIEREIEAVGARLRRAGVESFVIDTRAPYASDAQGRQLARALGGGYTRLPRPQSGA